MTERKQFRPEAEVFGELEALCSAPGYIHAIAYFCHRDNMILYSDEMKPEDMQHLFSRDRLIRTEITTLIGLMRKHEVSYEIPSSGVMQAYIDKTEKLLEELHWSISSAFFVGFDPRRLREERLNAFTTGAALREPIFYGGESSYSFQYRDLAVRKYCKDGEWLKAHKGFSIEMARDVVRAVGWLGDEKSVPTINAMMKLPPDQWTILPASEFSAREVVILPRFRGHLHKVDNNEIGGLRCRKESHVANTATSTNRKRFG